MSKLINQPVICNKSSGAFSEQNSSHFIYCFIRQVFHAIFLVIFFPLTQHLSNLPHPYLTQVHEISLKTIILKKSNRLKNRKKTKTQQNKTRQTNKTKQREYMGSITC